MKPWAHAGILLASAMTWGCKLAPGSATSGPDGDAAALRAGLESGDCDPIADLALRDACWVRKGDCAPVIEEEARDECGFVRAEREGDIRLCRDAGRFADDCRMHLWTASFAHWAPSDRSPGAAEALVAAQAKDAGFAVDDPRPWSAWYRHALGATRPFDRPACRKIADAKAQEACLQTALALYDDLLNMARDRKLYPCDGGPLPALLERTPDPDLDALVARRTDLCP